MRSNDNNRRTQPGRGTGAGRDGRSFDKNKSASGPKDFRSGGAGKSFDKPKFSDRSGKPSEYRGAGKPSGEKRFEGGEARTPRSFDKPKFGDKGRSTDTRGGARSFGDKPKFNDYKGNRSEGRDSRPDSRGGSDYKPRFEKKDGGDFKPRYDKKEGGDFKPRYDKKPEGGDYKPRFGADSNRSGGFKGGEKRSYNPNFNDSNKPARPARNFDAAPGDDFQPRLVKRTGGDESAERRTSYPKQHNLESYTETRFDASPTMRPRKSDDKYDPNAKYSKKKQQEFAKNSVDPLKPMRLNRFLANSGLCSRREADDYISAGVVTVNGIVVSELGAKVIPSTDRVLFHDQLVRSEKKVYLLLNKPKDCVTTTEDTNSRLTVMDLVKNACSERIYPVGRLDRNTTGVLLLTNDGDMAAKLMHPKHNKKKIYHVHLDKAVTRADLQSIAEGIELEDGMIKADSVNYVEEDDKKQIGIEIHSGRNRLVRRIFEHFGYTVVRLDRVFFAGLTKKHLSRGQWRFLNEKEIQMLRMGAYE